MDIVQLFFLFIVIIAVPISIHFLKKKIRHALWFLKIRYVFRIFWKSTILMALVYTFITTSFAYLTYPKYMATVDGYHEYNNTSEEGVKRTLYNTIYRFKVGEKSIRATDKKTSTSMKPKIGKHSEVIYKDGDLMVYHPILFLLVSLVGMGVLYFLIDLIKSDFVEKPLMPKEPLFGYASTSHEVSISFSLDKKEEEDDD